MEMNASQEIFSVFYAVLYGSMLSSSGELKLFPWGFPAECRNKQRKRLIRRLVFAIVCFNLIPFIFYAIIYLRLSDICNDQLNFINIVIIGMSSLMIYSIYRLWHFVMIITKSKEIIYSYGEYLEIVQKRGIRETPFGHLIATLFYVALTFPLFNYSILLYLIPFGLFYILIYYIIDE